MQLDYRDPMIRLLLPRYNELALFLMSISFILVFFTYDEPQTTLYKFLFNDFSLALLVWPAIFVFGLMFSLYHVFTERRKTVLEKWAMLIFAVFVNAFSGIAAGIHILSHAFDALPEDASVIQWTPASILMLFPIWNIFNGVWLLLMLRLGIIDKQNITEENATRLQVLLSLMILLLVFLFCHTVFKLHWTLTFSICVASSTSVSGIVQDSLPGSQIN